MAAAATTLSALAIAVAPAAQAAQEAFTVAEVSLCLGGRLAVVSYSTACTV